MFFFFPTRLQTHAVVPAGDETNSYYMKQFVCLTHRVSAGDGRFPAEVNDIKARMGRDG